MGLTKPRASQIYNLDYKQATRVVTVTDITLSGGAPSQVDGVSLSLGDRILVTGQSTASQNGLYLVATLGSGGNGTWIRTGDGNETGEIEAGMIIMVTEGVAYQDTQWKLITDNPIVIGTTPLTFTQNYSANSISGGTSNVTVFSNANVTISSAGTSNVLIISSTGTVTSGTASVTGNITGSNILTGGLVSATGNVTGNYILGNGALLTGVITSVANINNGTSNITVVSSGGNITVGIDGTSNVAVFSNAGLDVNGAVSVLGNITGGNIFFDDGVVSGTGNIYANKIFANIVGNIDAAGNITEVQFNTTGDQLGASSTFTFDSSSNLLTVGGNVQSGNMLTTGNISAQGNVIGNYIFGNGSFLTGIANINNGTSNVTVVSSNGNITVGINGTGNVAVFSTDGLDIVGNVSTTGNVAGDYILGNGSQLTGLVTNSISDGNSNVVVNGTDGNVTIGINGVANTVEVSPGELTVYGVWSNPKTISSNVVIGNNINSMLIGPIAVDPAGNIFVPTGSTLNII